MENKILFIVQLPPPVHGASVVNRHIVDSGLLASEYQTKVLPLKFVSDVSEIGSVSGRKVLLMLQFLYKLIGELIVYRPQLVYYTIAPKGNAFFRDALFVSLIKLFGVKIVFHLHSRGIQQSMQAGRLRRGLYRYVFKGSYVISLSKALKAEFVNLKVKEVLILPNGLPELVYDLSQRQEEKPVVLFLSNLFKAKGIYVFLDAVEKLKQQGATFRANIVGMEGDVSVEELESLVKERRLEDTISILGPLYGEQKHKVLAGASIFVMPSYDEAFPLTLLEAMQASLPVVASAVGGIPEIVEEGRTGYLCQPGDSGLFAQRIELLLRDVQLRQQMGQAGRKAFESKFTLKRFECNLKANIDNIFKSI